VCFGDSGSRLRHGGELSYGAIEIAKLPEHGAQPVSRFDQIRLQSHSLLIGRQRVTRMTGSLERKPQMEPRFGKLRRPLDGATKCRERLIQVTKLAKRHADCVLDDGIVGIDRSGAAKLYERQIELAETEVREALLPV
jgi:hypothetical protein